MILNDSGKFALFVALGSTDPVGLMASAGAVAQETGTLSGVVFDPQGATGPNSEVELRWNDATGEMCWTSPNWPKAKKPRVKEITSSGLALLEQRRPRKHGPSRTL
jgi:hypothetical protein